MGERTSHAPGTFSWADLATTDPDAAKTFYAGLFGWEFEDMPAGDEEAQMPSFWMACFGCENADATVDAVRAAGGQVYMPPFAAGPGRYAVVADPQGAAFTVYAGEFQD